MTLPSISFRTTTEGDQNIRVVKVDWTKSVCLVYSYRSILFIPVPAYPPSSVASAPLLYARLG